MSSLTTRLITTREEFARLGPEWDALLDRSSIRSVFLTWGWLYTWWCALGGSRELRICEVRDGSGRLTGIGPFCIQPYGRLPRLRLLTFLGTSRVSSDYLDVIADPSHEEEVVAAVWRALWDDQEHWDLARWPDMLESALLLRHGGHLGNAADLARETRLCQVCPYLPLAGDPDAQMAAFGSNLRMNVKRKIRTLERAGLIIETAADGPTLGPALEALYALHHRRWSQRNQAGNFQDPRVREFHAKLVEHFAASERMRLYTLRHAGAILAVLYTLQYKDTMSYYQSGYEPDAGVVGLGATEYSPGFALLAHSILDATRRGLQEYDFLRGPEAYKGRWTKQRRITRGLTLIPRQNWRALGRHRIERGVALSKRLVNRLLRRQADAWSLPS